MTARVIVTLGDRKRTKRSRVVNAHRDVTSTDKDCYHMIRRTRNDVEAHNWNYWVVRRFIANGVSYETGHLNSERAWALGKYFPRDKEA